ncbi:MAG TPA: putative 2-aminoethylphosphonate ABC transporter substrate-binding protein [Candidatus Choladousia intestinigallinarum]|nr:putative 2-aminoethylphosphonate ABC transporter substrate-binding protein [Candidatus Choladousia intestinigallinarum]
MKKKICIALIGALTAAAFAGCSGGGSSQSGETTAETAGSQEAGTETSEGGSAQKADSGEITVYTALEDEQVSDYLAKFSETYPDITVNVVRESTGIITAKLIAEKDNPQADLVWGTAASSMMVLDDMGALEPYEPEGCDRILPQFKSDKEVPTWVGIDAWETAFVVNTEELKKLGMEPEEIKSYEDLLDPRLKGQIVMSNPNSSGTGFLTVSAILQLKGKDSEAGWDYLDQLHENIAQYVHSGSKPAKMAASGECAVGISFGYAGISQRDKGAPVEVIFPEEGSGWDLEANALMKKEEINPAAYTFLDWAISDEAMDLYRVNYPIVTVENTGTYEGYDSNPLDQLIDNDFSWAAENRENILNEWMEKYDSKSEAES